MVLVGNKFDLAEGGERKVDQQAASDFAAKSNMMYYETSAKTDTGVTDLMNHMFGITYAYKKKSLRKENLCAKSLE